MEGISLEKIKEAQQRLVGTVHATPLIPLNLEVEHKKIYLKLENLQPIGSFKIRGACNAIDLIPSKELQNGVYTASAGNFAQGLAWNAKQRNIPCQVVVPDHVPDIKLQAMHRLAAETTKVPFDVWWNVLQTHHFDGFKGRFIHPVADPDVIAGNGTIGLEILESLPSVNTIIAPYGGGGLSSGIASAVKSIKPDVKVFACEVDTAAPLHASFESGEATSFDYKPSFVDGMGGKSILPEMWPLVKSVLDGSIVVSLQQIVDSIKLLVERNHVVAEGAGAAPVAAAMTNHPGLRGNIVCVISGGNLDTGKLIKILQNEIP